MSQAKYRAVPTTFEGERFDSKKEAARHADLLLLQRAGEITSLERQPKYPLNVNGQTITTYIGDWRYCERQRDGTLKLVVEDCKSPATAKIPAFRIKWKWVQALHPQIEWRLS